jgi:hypothetical protein
MSGAPEYAIGRDGCLYDSKTVLETSVLCDDGLVVDTYGEIWYSVELVHTEDDNGQPVVVEVHTQLPGRPHTI